MTWSSRQFPPELQNCPPDILESYVRARILALAGSASVSRRLGLSSEAVRQAFAETLTEAAPLRSLDSDADASGPPLELSFGHDCQSLGCLEPKCPLCTQNPNRRCSSSFSSKYLSGDVLKAKCGASIRVQVIDRATLEPVKGSMIENIFLEMCILDGKAYQALQDAGREQYEEDVESCVITLNNQGKELLVPGRGASHNDNKWVVVQLIRGEAHLPDLMVTGSSEALLSGQKPPFRLLVRAMNSSDNARAHNIRFSVSDAFVVATPRVRTAAKAEIPHLDDHVSKLHAVGNMTQNKLQDITAAASAVGVYNIKVPYNVVTKVGQFRELVEVAERDPQLCETLKKVLKLTRGWEVARDHAMLAVSTDNQMRIWYATGAGTELQDGGLLFKCHLGSVDLENPVGLLKRKGKAEEQQTTLEAILIQRLPASQKETIKRLQKQAAIHWWQPGHPGWAIWPVDTQHFLQDVAAPAGVLTTDHLISTTPTDSLPKSERPMTRAHAAQATDTQSSLSTGSASENPMNPHGHQLTRSSTPSEGGASLDGWMAATSQGQQQIVSPGSRAASREVRFPAQPTRQASPVWRNPTPQFNTRGGPNDQIEPCSLGRLDPAAMQWDNAGSIRPFTGSVRDHTSNDHASNGPAAAGLQHYHLDDSSLYREWTASSLGMTADTIFPGPQIADPWSMGQQKRNHLPSSYAGMRDYSASSGSMNPAHTDGAFGGLPQSLQHSREDPMPSSGCVRKRESDHNGNSAVGDLSNPLPSPFGHPEMQNVELPAPTPMLPKNPPSLGTRISSGMEPANAKRPHYSPAVLQERLSHLFGRPVGPQEMSRLIPNFPDLLGDPNATHDLPSMLLTTSDLASLMDDMLENRNPGGGMTHRTDAGMTTTEQSGLGPDFPKFNSYTYGDLADAVDMMHEGRALPPGANAGLDKPRSSSMLMEFMAARLGGLDGQLLVPDGNREQPHGDLGQRRSGLDTMQAIEDALPTPEPRRGASDAGRVQF